MRINAVLDREIKVKMRGWRAPLLISSYLALLAGIVAIIFFTQENSARYNMYYNFSPRIVYDVFIALLMFELALILIITPALTAASISGERERQTLDLLLCTRLSPISIVTGKLAASISQIILLLLASIPVFGIVFLYGGVSLLDLSLYMLFFIATSVMVGSMGVCFSALFKKSVFSTVLTYIIVLLITFGNAIAHSIFASIYYPATGNTPTYFHIMAFYFANPLLGIGSIMGANTMGIFPVHMVQGTLMGPYNVAPIEIHVQPWVINIIFDAIAAIVFITISTLKLRTRKK